LEAAATCTEQLERPAAHRVFIDVEETGEDAEATKKALEERALTAFSAQLCRGWRCDTLPKPRVVESREQGGNTCTLVALSDAQFAPWIKPAQDELDELLEREAARMAQNLRERSQPLRVIVPALVDHGMEGGHRARWVRAQMMSALRAAGVEVIETPADWYGRGVPSPAAAAVRGTIRQNRSKPERFDLVWALQHADATANARPEIPRALEVVRALADDVAAETARPELLIGRAGSVGARLVGDAGGGMCAGEETALWVDLEAPMFVRVFMLDGEGRASLVFPRERAEASVALAAGPRELLKFTAGTYQGVGAARLVVVAAASEDGLGRLRQFDRACAMPETDAKRMHDGSLIPPTAIETSAAASYRLLGEPVCEQAAQPARGLEWLNGLPTCGQQP
jgi:hypothetical protein